MEVYPNGYLCQVCKTFLPSKRERGRTALIGELRAGGFLMLLLATLVYSESAYQPLFPYLGLLAGYTFYFLSIAKTTIERLHIQ